MNINESIKRYLIAELFLTNQLDFKNVISYKNGRYIGPLILIDIFINTHRKHKATRLHCRLTKEHNYKFTK